MYLNRNSLQKNIAKLFYFSLIFFSTFSILPNAAQSISLSIILFFLLAKIQPSEFKTSQVIIISIIVFTISISYIQSINIAEFQKRLFILLPILVWTIISPSIHLNINPKQLYYIKFGFLITIIIYIILFLQFYLFGLNQYYANDLNIYPMIYTKLDYNSLNIFEKLKCFYLEKNSYLNAEYVYSTLNYNNEFFRHHLYVSLILTLGIIFSFEGIQSNSSSKIRKLFYCILICIYLLFMLFIEGQSKWICLSVIMIILLTKIIVPSIQGLKVITIGGFVFFTFLYINSVFNFVQLSLPLNITIIDSNRIAIVQSILNNVSLEQLLSGIGMGDIQDLLNSYLPKNILSKGLNNQFIYLNTHNQYLDLLLSFGFFGLVIFLLIVFYYKLKYWEVTRKFPYLIYSFLLLIMLFFENLMNRSWGICFIIFYLLILKIEYENMKYHIKE